MADELSAVRARLIKARKRAGYTQQAAAEAIGLSRASSLSDLETGRNELGLRHLLSLCALYGISASSLFSPAEAAVRIAELEAENAQLRETQANIRALVNGALLVATAARRAQDDAP